MLLVEGGGESRGWKAQSDSSAFYSSSGCSRSPISHRLHLPRLSATACSLFPIPPCESQVRDPLSLSYPHPMAAMTSTYVGLSRAAATFGVKAEKDIKDFVPKAALGGKQVRDKIASFPITGASPWAVSLAARAGMASSTLDGPTESLRARHPPRNRPPPGMGITRSLIRAARRLRGGGPRCLT
jgi:hypothetical protein